MFQPWLPASLWVWILLEQPFQVEQVCSWEAAARTGQLQVWVWVLALPARLLGDPSGILGNLFPRPVP